MADRSKRSKDQSIRITRVTFVEDRKRFLDTLLWLLDVQSATQHSKDQEGE